MVKVLILGITLQDRVQETELDLDLEGPTAIKLLSKAMRIYSMPSRRSWCGRIAPHRESENRIARFSRQGRDVLKISVVPS